MTASDCDIIIIGSGFGGSVCALRTAQAGLRTVVLERGQRMTPEAYAALADGKAPVFHAEREPGVLELHRLSGLLALTASAVGGGSNIYTAVTIRPPCDIFEDHWPPGINAETMTSYYDRVERMIAPTPIPATPPRMAALDAVAARMNASAVRLPLSMDWPDDPAALCRRPEVGGVYQELATWLQGGYAASKRTLAQTYLSQAESAGADVCALHDVVAITPASGGYRVDYRMSRNDEWHDGSVLAPRVILAAGTLNTTRLLLHCRDMSKTFPEIGPTLGQRFFTNGDFGGLLVGANLDLPPDAGPPVTGWIDLWDRERIYLMETGLVPFDFGSFSGLLNPVRWFGGLRLGPAKRSTWSFGTMGDDTNPGTLTLGRSGRLAHRRDRINGKAFHARTMAVLRGLATVTGGKMIVPPAAVAKRLPITVHPLGGAVMAESPDTGVADTFGEVFGYPGLYVADGSLIPAPTGVPPSMTIAAVAERIADHLVGGPPPE